MGRKALHGVSSTFFREPTLIALRELSGGKVDEFVTYQNLEENILKQLQIDIMWKGRQPQTNRPLVRVWIGAILSKLRQDNLLTGKGNSAALTSKGIKEADAIMGRIISNPTTKPAIPPVLSTGEPSDPVPPLDPNKIYGLTAEEIARENAKKELIRLEERKLEIQAERKQQIKEGDAINIFGMTVKVNKNVPSDVCLPLPDFYQFPRTGPASKQAKETAIALHHKRSTFIWGLPGSGKDAFVHAYSSLTKTPSQIFTVSPNEDIQSWFYIRSFEKEGTSWEEGEFLKAARDGYTAPDGSKHPYLILVSDIDRATKNQAEALRLVMDSIQGRIMGPKGIKYPLYPGTQIVATANSSGSGDSRGRCVSSNVLDASILDRFERKFKFDTLEWMDEEQILKNKFPIFDKMLPTAWKNIGECVNSLRKAVDMFAEFGHRSICAWVGHVQDILETDYEFTQSLDKKTTAELLKRGLAVLLDAMPDEETRLEVQRLTDPYLLGGVVGK